MASRALVRPRVAARPAPSRRRLILGSDYRWRDAGTGRLVSLGDVVSLAELEGVEWRRKGERRYRKRRAKIHGEAEVRLHRVKGDPLSELLGAGHLAGGRGEGRIHVYTPKSARLGQVSGLLDRFARDPRVADFGPRILVLMRVQMPDGSLEWRTASFGSRPDVAFADAASRTAGWARGYAPSMRSSIKWKAGQRWSVDYRAAKVVWVEVRRLPELEVRAHAARNQAKVEGARWRAVQSRDRGRGGRSTRGR